MVPVGAAKAIWPANFAWVGPWHHPRRAGSVRGARQQIQHATAHPASSWQRAKALPWPVGCLDRPRRQQRADPRTSARAARSDRRPWTPRGCQKRPDAAAAQGGKMAAGGGILCMGVSLWGLLLKSRSSWWNGKLLMFGSTVRVIGGVYGCARTLADVLARVLSVTRFDS